MRWLCKLPGGLSAAASKGLLLSPRRHLEHSSPSKEVSQQLQMLLAQQSPSVPESGPSWALAVSGASELQKNRAHYSWSPIHTLSAPPCSLHIPNLPLAEAEAIFKALIIEGLGILSELVKKAPSFLLVLSTLAPPSAQP